MSVPEITKVDFSHFPTDERFVQIPGQLVMTDSIDENWIEEDNHQHTMFPVQVTMSVNITCLSGKVEMNIDLNDYTLTDGCTALILPGSFFQMKSIEKGSKCIFLAISPDFARFTGDVKTGIEFGRKLKENPIHHPSAAELEENVTLYKALKKKLQQKDFNYMEEVARAYLRIMQCNIFHSFAEEMGRQVEHHPTGRKETLFMQFMAVVKEHYIINRNIAFYADKLCVSPKYLSTVVHTVSSKYASEWINQYVVLEAKTMLRTEGVSIKDVSNKLNFANQSFFAKYFKQHTGYTPKEYKAL